MSGSTRERARKISEPALLGAIAAVLHLADVFLAMGMIGSLLCPLPHALAVFRHGKRTGALASLASVAAVSLFTGILQGASHLFLFVAPGFAAGVALRQKDRWHSILYGTSWASLGVAASYYLIEMVLGLTDIKFWKLPEELLALVASPFRYLQPDERLFSLVPGLASEDLRHQFLVDLLKAPIGLFVLVGFMSFYLIWLVATALLQRLGETTETPPLPLTPKMPLWLGVSYGIGATSLLPPGYWADCLEANLQFLAMSAAFLVGFLHLLLYARTRPGGILWLLAGVYCFYFISIWVGFLTCLSSDADTHQEWILDPTAQTYTLPGQEAQPDPGGPAP